MAERVKLEFRDVAPRCSCGSESQELAVRRKPERRTDRSDPGQLDQQLPPPRDGSATLLHATADESSLVAGKRHRRLASRSLETSSHFQVRGFGNTPSRFLKTVLHVSLTDFWLTRCVRMLELLLPSAGW